MINYGFGEIIGILLFLFPLLIYLLNVLFDGFGYLRDIFHFSTRHR